MGYTTQFSGTLKFVNPVTAEQILALQNILGEDCRDHPEWDEISVVSVNLQLTKDASGLQWNGAEKTYHLPLAVNVIIAQMQKQFPDFALTGKLLAQGEEVGDVWYCEIVNGLAVEKKIEL